MSQVGVIVIDDSINVDAWVNIVKSDPKVTVGNIETTVQGVKYIPIVKKPS